MASFAHRMGFASLVAGLVLALAQPIAAADTPAVTGLKTPPEMQDARKERNLKAPGKLTGQAQPRALGKMPPPSQLKKPSLGGPQGQETPQSFRERHRLHPGAASGQGSRDVMLNQRIQGQRPSSMQRVITPPKPKAQQPAEPAAQPGENRLPMSEEPSGPTQPLIDGLPPRQP